MLLLGFSGRRGAGKNSVAKFLRQNSIGMFGFDARVREYSFADPIKRICIDVMGLSEKQCYGSDADKATLTPYTFEDAPFYSRMLLEKTQEVKPACVDVDLSWIDAVFEEARRVLPSGQMTARDLMQYIGTETFRRWRPTIWTEALIRQIEKENPSVALVTDVRFPNEVQAIKDAGGYTIRLTRDPHQDAHSRHASEHALDPEVFNWDLFDGVLDNAKLSEDETNSEVRHWLRSRGLTKT